MNPRTRRIHRMMFQRNIPITQENVENFVEMLKNPDFLNQVNVTKDEAAEVLGEEVEPTPPPEPEKPSEAQETPPKAKKTPVKKPTKKTTTRKRRATTKKKAADES
jgi:hypothetical protein